MNILHIAHIKNPRTQFSALSELGKFMKSMNIKNKTIVLVMLSINIYPIFIGIRNMCHIIKNFYRNALTNDRKKKL
jgi:hypothetical protein